MSDRKLLNDGEMKLEAASGLEPESRGFADLRLNHLATPPRAIHYRRKPGGRSTRPGTSAPGVLMPPGLTRRRPLP